MELRWLHPMPTTAPCTCCGDLIDPGMPRAGDFDGTMQVGVLCPLCVRLTQRLEAIQWLRTFADALEMEAFEASRRETPARPRSGRSGERSAAPRPADTTPLP
jgi:hypothetical protein